MPEPDEDFPVFEFDQAELARQMGKYIKIPPQVEVPESPGIDELNAWRAEAEDEARSDEIKIKETAQSLISGLDHADVEQLRSDLFRASASEITLARQSADAVMRAREYLELAISEGPSTEQRTREYAKAVTQAYAATSATGPAAFESGTKDLRADATTARAELEELGRMRRALEQEQQAGSSGQRASDISKSLTQIGAQETILRLRILGSENTSSTLDSMRALQALETTMSEAVNWMWSGLARELLALERRRHRRSGWFRRMYAAILLGYAVIFVGVGVGADALLAHTPYAGVLLSFGAALALFGVDRWFISRRLERWDKRNNVRLLKDEVTVCAETLAKIRSSQVEIDAMASASGVPKRQLLNKQLLA